MNRMIAPAGAVKAGKIVGIESQQNLRAAGRAVAAMGLGLLLTACAPLSFLGGPAETPSWEGLERADVFEGVSGETEVVGRPQKIIASHEDTFTDIARRFNLGYDEMRAANPGVDPWIPGEGTEILLPTAHIIPEGKREGIVINLPAMRLWWFGPPDEEGRQTVITHPIGIGKIGWATPVGEFHVISRATDPSWYPPASVRREHERAGDPLPAVVPPGPDNPLGRHAVRLNLPSYLIHGTNRPAGIGLRASHGCIRLYPEDIASLYDQMPVGIKVRMVDQPWLAGWHDGQLLFEAHGPLEDGQEDWMTGLELLRQRAGERTVDWARVAAVREAGMGVPLPIVDGSPAPEEWLARAPRVENRARGNFHEIERERLARDDR
jgi:L,D-transpeptidase ErfK/SrfK